MWPAAMEVFDHLQMEDVFDHIQWKKSLTNYNEDIVHQLEVVDQVK